MMSKLVVLLAVLAAVNASASHFYVSNNNTGSTCVIFDGEFKFNLVFPNSTEKYTAVINETLEVDGDCNAVIESQAAQTLTVNFNPDQQSSIHSKDWQLEIVFGSTTNEAFKIKDFTLKSQITDTIPLFATFKADPKSLGDVFATGNSGYKCSVATLGLVGGGSIEVSGANVIAFASLNGTEFPAQQTYDVCFLDSRTSDVVPIVVGACLAGLVVVVLVAYLIGRARAKRQVQDEKGDTCLIMDGDFKFYLQITHMNETKEYNVSMQEIKYVSGKCGEDLNYLSVEFEPTDHQNDSSWKVWFYFDKPDNETYSLANYSLSVTPTNTIPTSVVFQQNKTHNEIFTSENHDFKCSTVNLELEGNSRIEIKNAKIILNAHSKQEFDVCSRDVYRHSSTEKIVIIVVVIVALIVLFFAGLASVYHHVKLRRQAAYPAIN
ncbi:unnamed protein product [Caenorhabditis angaria]|uniref:Lysosome-associated membrane glycoprotein 2-like transmembrane domain-containing protein n=1 Tax=Caenorhabditis angaria TaxID=860376 RepID=A0A9P1J4S9_9PELO|nr:unnamed protein product [Caenorhabditis angaria]